MTVIQEGSRECEHAHILVRNNPIYPTEWSCDERDCGRHVSYEGMTNVTWKSLPSGSSIRTNWISGSDNERDYIYVVRDDGVALL